MQVPYGQHGRAGYIGAYRWKLLHPAIERGPEKRKLAFRHSLMLEDQVFGDDRNPFLQPGFVALGGFDDVEHDAAPRDGGRDSVNREQEMRVRVSREVSEHTAPAGTKSLMDLYGPQFTVLRLPANNPCLAPSWQPAAHSLGC